MPNQFQLLLAVVSTAVLFADVANAEVNKNTNILEIFNLSDFQRPVTNVRELLVQDSSSNSQLPVIVAGVRIVPSQNGIEVILETKEGDKLQPGAQEEGNTVVIDIPSSQLQIQSGNTFRQINPLAGITEISVININSNTIRLKIVGKKTLPKVELFSSDEGLIFGVTSDASAPTSPPQAKPEQSAENEEPIELVVTATRTEEDLQNVPRTVTVIKREQIEELAPVSRDLSDIIGKLTPGAGPPTGTIRNTTVRGCPPQILIDGIPVTSNDSNAGYQRDLRSIAPNAVERIEIVRGPNAVYGDGATGGVINIITRKPSEQGLVSETQVGIDVAGNLEGDSFGNFFQNKFSFSVRILEEVGLSIPELQQKLSNSVQSYVSVGIENLDLLDADVMFVALDPGSAKNFTKYNSHQFWQMLNVVKNNRVYTVDSGYWIVGNILSANAILDDLSQYLLRAE